MMLSVSRDMAETGSTDFQSKAMFTSRRTDPANQSVGADRRRRDCRIPQSSRQAQKRDLPTDTHAYNPSFSDHDIAALSQ